jgi:hypothetical protein
VAVEVAVDRLEPAAPDALGELWLPQDQPGGRRPLWAAGRYVIRLAAPSGGYERYLGMQVGLPEPEPTLEPSLEPAARDALGELWLPREQAGGRRPLWAPGRYVIRLAAPSGGYERYLGMQVGLPEPGPEPSTSPEPTAARTAEPPSATGTAPAP